MNLTEAWNRIRDRLRRDRLASELDEELRFHRAMLERDQTRDGASPEEMRRRARLALGNVSYFTELARDLWSLGWVDDLLHDVRYAARGLRSRPGFTLAVTLTLALGIGANAAIFSIVDRLLFRPPPLLAHPALTNRIYVAQSDRGREGVWPGMSYARYLDFARWTTSFTRTAAFTTATLAVGVGDDAREMPVAAVSASFFGFFDAAPPPALGRYFTAQEDSVPSGTPVVVLSHALWEVRFGGRTDALGATLQIGPTLYTVIGVAPAGFAGLSAPQPPAAYIPISAYAATSGFQGSPGDEWWQTYHWNFAQMIAERKPDVSVARANADLTNAYRRSYAVQRDVSPDIPPIELARPRTVVASVLAERGPHETSVGKVATLVTAMAVVVLLIACANVANLLLAAALRRRREIAVRLALGVSRARLLSQLLTESVLLALLGGAAGLVVAQWGGTLLRSLFLPKDATTSVVGDPRTLIVAGAAALIAGLLTGLAPVWQSWRANLAHDLKAGAREGGWSHHRSRTRAVLLVMQGALSVVLLVGAGLFVRSLRHVRELRLGYDVDPVLIVDVNMRGVKLDSAHAVLLRQQLLEQAQHLPGVARAALHMSVPFWRTLDGRNGISVDLRVAGIDSVDRLGEFYLDAVTPDYFATMGTRILRGRGIGQQDAAGDPGAMVVSEAMAKVLWPTGDPIGQCVRVIAAATKPGCTYVVGVAEDIKGSSLSDDKGYYYYLSSAQFHPQQAGVFVRMRGDAAAQVEAIRRGLQPLMPGTSYVTVTPFADVIGAQMRSWQLGATMFTAFGALALLLAAVGLYSVIAYNVAQRTHELGVRIALGAEVADVLGLVVGQGLRLGVAGVAIGGIIAFSAARWLKPLLFQESARDPAVYTLVTVVLLAVAILASYLPARRAARVDPKIALRAE